MNLSHLAIVAALGLFLGLLALLELGRSLGRRRSRKEPESARSGLGAIEGALFGLMGLLLAFTFSGAAARFDARRQLIVQEANDIGTAWLRLDLLPSPDQPPLRELFRHYTDQRLKAFKKLPDLEAMRAEIHQAASLQSQIWQLSVAACRTDAGRPATPLLLPALNAMFDVATTRNMSVEFHPPILIYTLLASLALVSALLAGFGMATAKTRSWIHLLGFTLIMSVTFYIIIDYELPRIGILRVESFDRALQEVRASMN